MNAPAIIACADCGQKNRVSARLPAGKVAICGRCQAPLEDLDDDLELDDDDDSDN